MASYTDKAPTFSPYVAQKPVDAMVKVGMYKQAQYQQGYEKIQDSIDNIAGLDIVRPQDKAHLQTKLNELGTKLQSVAAADFSNFQLSNSVAGMASSLIKDPGISGAVGATQRFKREQEFVAAAKKDGTLTPDNLLHYQKQVKSYFDDEEIGASFNGQYVPHFDVFEFAKETFSEILPDGMSYDEVFILGKDGLPVEDKNGNLMYAPAMTRIMKEGRFPEKVRQTLNQIFSDPRVAQQLQISGEYNYQGLDSDALIAKTNRLKDKVSASYEEKRIELGAQLMAGRDVQKQLDELDVQKQRSIDYYESLAELAGKDSERARGALYKDEVNSRYTTMFGQIKTETQILSSPPANFQFKLKQEANDIWQWEQEQLYKRDRDKIEDSQWQATHDQRAKLAGDKLKADNAGLDGGGTGPAGSGGALQGPEDANFDNSSFQQQNYINAGVRLKEANNALVYKFLTDTNGVLEDEVKDMVTQGVLSETEAINFVIDRESKGVILDEELQRVNAIRISNSQEPQTKQELYVEKVIDATSKELFSMRPQDRQQKPISTHLLREQIKANKAFTAESLDNKTIEDALLIDFKDQSEPELIASVEPQTMVYKDIEYELSPKDIVDLAIIRRGTKHRIFGFLDNRLARRAAEQAQNRLKANGKGPVIDAMRADLVVHDASQDPFNYIPSLIKDNVIQIGIEAYKYESERGVPTRKWDQMFKVYDAINNEKSIQRMERREEITKEVYSKNPNLNTGLLTGNTETDKKTITALSRMAGEYNEIGQNMSPTFAAFYTHINDARKNEYGIGTSVVTGADNQPAVSVKIYDSTLDGGKNTPAMVITDAQAKELQVDTGRLFDTPEVHNVRKTLDNQGKTSKWNIEELSTYLKIGGGYFTMNDLPYLESNIVDVQANIEKRGNMYFPILYINNGEVRFTEWLTESSNLGDVVREIKNSDALLINSLISEEYVKRQTEYNNRVKE